MDDDALLCDFERMYIHYACLAPTFEMEYPIECESIVELLNACLALDLRETWANREMFAALQSRRHRSRAAGFPCM